MYTARNLAGPPIAQSRSDRLQVARGEAERDTAALYFLAVRIRLAGRHIVDEAGVRTVAADSTQGEAIAGKRKVHHRVESSACAAMIDPRDLPAQVRAHGRAIGLVRKDRKSTRLNSSH